MLKAKNERTGMSGAGGRGRVCLSQDNGSQGRCVSRNTARSDWSRGSGQGLALTWAPPTAATPQSGTNPSRPPATPEAPLTCCPHCGLWPPCRQSRTASEVREAEAGRAAVGQQGLPHASWASHQLHRPGHDASPQHAPVSLSVTQGVRTGPTSLSCRGDYTR